MVRLQILYTTYCTPSYLLGVMFQGPRGFIQVRYYFRYQACERSFFFVSHALPCLLGYLHGHGDRLPQAAFAFGSNLKEDLAPVSFAALAHEKSLFDQTLNQP